MSDFITYSSDNSFEADVIKAPIAIVDFWAEWCGPCRALGPIFEQVAEEYKEKLKFVKLNVDESPNTAAQYKIRGIPTIALFKNGQVAATKVGSLSKVQLIEFINNNI